MVEEIKVEWRQVQVQFRLIQLSFSHLLLLISKAVYCSDIQYVLVIKL